MVLFNYSTKELTAKVVYYGPGLCGKTTNLQYVHANLPGNVKGKMLSLATKTDRTLFFDFLPLDLGTIRGMKTRIQLYTVPGQVFYNETRKLVLKGADGIVFVADSQEQMLQANVESFRNLEENLKGHGMSLADMPHVLQFNKRDLPRIAGIEDMNAKINKFNAPFYESVATTGIGVQDTLKAITKLVLLHLTRKYDPRSSRPAASAAAAPAAPAVAASPAASAAAPPPLDPTATIPLQSEPPRSTPPPPPDFHGPAPSGPEPAAPSFDDDEVDAFIGEVAGSPPAADREADGVAASGPAIDEPVLEPFPRPDAPDASDDLPSIEVPEIDTPVEHGGDGTRDDGGEIEIDVPTGVVDEPPADGAEGLPLAASADDGPSTFEVDGSVDPAWAPTDDGLSGGLQSTPAPDASVPPPPLDVPDGPDAGTETAAEPDDAPIDLTVAADDRSLFEDPGLDVAKLAAGHAKEIVVPVELGDGDDVRRFKLSVTLRLDPVD